MGERRSLGCLAREPLYNTRAVAQTTGVPADTFRAWERRYGLPRPFRAPSNQRLYSEQDIGVVNWLRERTVEGMTISQAIQRLKLEVPDVFLVREPAELPPHAPDSDQQTIRLQQRLLDAVTAFDADRAERVIDDALARFSVDMFCTRLVEPAHVEIAQRRDRGQLGVAVDHFATRLLERRLAAILSMVAPLAGRRAIVAASPPGLAQEVDLLVLAIALARHGWQVVYLGATIPTEALVDAACAIFPDVVCLHTSTSHAATQASVVVQALDAGNDRRLPVVAGRTAAEVMNQIASVVDLESSQS